MLGKEISGIKCHFLKALLETNEVHAPKLFSLNGLKNAVSTMDLLRLSFEMATNSQRILTQSNPRQSLNATYEGRKKCHDE